MSTLLTPSGEANSVRVLVVEDDTTLARALERVLRMQGFVVDTALEGQAALDKLGADTYDVMLLDLRMSSMDGMEVFRRAQSGRAPPATILHSAHVDIQTAVVAIRAGVQEVMEKPVPEQILAARIRQLAGERRTGHGRSVRAIVGGSPQADALVHLVGDSPSMVALRDHVCRVAHFRDLSVLVQGPTGTGKELVAQAIHALTCPTEPFVSVNCAAIPEQLFESELFGHEAGAFTNAKASRVGLLEEAARGTLFLDEIGEMPLALQAKLLRVLEIRQFRRVGGNRTRVLAARIVSATNRALSSDLPTTMRPDLFFRLAGYTIPTPPLSDRLGDIEGLARYFLEEFASRHGTAAPVLGPDALAALHLHSWPGNVRELRAVVENAAIVSRQRVIGSAEVNGALRARGAFDRVVTESITRMTGHQGIVSSSRPASDDPGDAVASPRRYASLPDLQKDVILRAFEETGQNLSQTAQELGIPRSTLRARLRKYGVR